MAILYYDYTSNSNESKASFSKAKDALLVARMLSRQEVSYELEYHGKYGNHYITVSCEHDNLLRSLVGCEL